MTFYPVTKSGRVANELAKGRGSVIHVIDTDEKPSYKFGYHGGWKKALCGTIPGSRRGNGWTNEGFDPLVATCPKCLKKMTIAEGKRPDADLLFLEMQQEIAELKRFQKAEEERDEIMRDLAESFQLGWADITDSDYAPKSSVFIQMLLKYSPDIVKQSMLITAKKKADRDLYNMDAAVRYTWGVAKRISERLEEEIDG